MQPHLKRPRHPPKTAKNGKNAAVLPRLKARTAKAGAETAVLAT